MVFQQKLLKKEKFMKNIFNNKINKRIINYAGPYISEEDVKFTANSLKKGFYKNYRFYTRLLEKKISKILKVKYVVATSSCTAAIHLALLACKIKKGDEVITADSSCVATALPIMYVGATPVFSDVEKKNWCLSNKTILESITKKTKAIIVVHWNGFAAEINKIMRVAKKRGIFVIEDAAAAFCGELNKKKLGTFGDLGCFSFQGAKIATGGMGGAIVTNNKKMYEKIRILSNLGRTDSVKKYWSDYLGWNYEMSNLTAALIYSQIKKINFLLAKKKKIYYWYKKYFNNYKKINLIEGIKNAKNTYCYPCLLINSKESIANDLISYLQKNKIDARNAQPQISSMPIFGKKFNNKNSKLIDKNGIILPSAYNINEKNVKTVCLTIKKYLNKKIKNN
jgi:perosamine synthetase